jgi:hypothetical protein
MGNAAGSYPDHELSPTEPVHEYLNNEVSRKDFPHLVDIYPTIVKVFQGHD